jgi:hypothetical protein
LLERLAGLGRAWLPPPPEGPLSRLAAPTLLGRTGKQPPLAPYPRRNQWERFAFAHPRRLVAPWGRLRLPVGAVVLAPKRRGQQHSQRRPFRPALPPPAGAGA